MVGKIVSVKGRRGLWLLRSKFENEVDGYWGLPVTKTRDGWNSKDKVRPIHPENIGDVVYESL